jgi:hypothetical protein
MIWVVWQYLEATDNSKLTALSPETAASYYRSGELPDAPVPEMEPESETKNEIEEEIVDTTIPEKLPEPVTERNIPEEAGLPQMPPNQKKTLVQPMIDLAMSRVMTNGPKINEAITSYLNENGKVRIGDIEKIWT